MEEDEDTSEKKYRKCEKAGCTATCPVCFASAAERFGFLFIPVPNGQQSVLQFRGLFSPLCLEKLSWYFLKSPGPEKRRLTCLLCA